MLCVTRWDNSRFTVPASTQQWRRNLRTVPNRNRRKTTLHSANSKPTLYLPTQSGRITKAQSSFAKCSWRTTSDLRRHGLLNQTNQTALFPQNAIQADTWGVAARFSTYAAAYASAKPSSSPAKTPTASFYKPVKASALPAYKPAVSRTRAVGPGQNTSSSILKSRENAGEIKRAAEEAERRSKAEALEKERQFQLARAQQVAEAAEAVERERRERLEKIRREAAAKAAAEAEAVAAAMRRRQLAWKREVDREISRWRAVAEPKRLQREKLQREWEEQVHREIQLWGAIGEAERLKAQWQGMSGSQKWHAVDQLNVRCSMQTCSQRYG